MRFSDLLVGSLASLRQRLFRTSLTVLGVVIGTVSVVVMVSLGVGLTADLERHLQNVEMRSIRVHSAPNVAQRQHGGLDDDTLAQLRLLTGLEQVYPVYNLPLELHFDGRSVPVEVHALPAEAFALFDLKYEFGGPPQPQMPLQLLAGGNVNEMLWDGLTPEPPKINWQGKRVTISLTEFDDQPLPPQGQKPDDASGAKKRVPVKISGQLRSDPTAISELDWYFTADVNALVQTLKREFPGKKLPSQKNARATPGAGFVYSHFEVVAATPEDAAELVKTLKELGYQVEALIEWIRAEQQQAVTIQLVLGGIGFVSLLVAAIGIANTMLMSVYERTKEIGIMKVLGAAMRDIRRLFLLESAAIGFIGGVLGILLSYGVSHVLNSISRDGATGVDVGMGLQAVPEEFVPPDISVIPLWLPLAALAGATLIGAISGWLPAHRAMRLSALGAIRSQ